MKRMLTPSIIVCVLLLEAIPFYAQAQTTWTVPTLVDSVSADLDQFWKAVFDNSDLDYATPGVFAYVAPSRTACGAAQSDNALYCSASHSIHYDQEFLDSLLTDIGDYAVATVIAHEWGHAVQIQLGLLRGSLLQVELQADCLAGAYTKHADSNGILEQGDVDEGRTLLAQLGDPPSRNRRGFSRVSHGTAAQRVSAFNTGYTLGVNGCL